MLFLIPQMRSVHNFEEEVQCSMQQSSILELNFQFVEEAGGSG